MRARDQSEIESERPERDREKAERETRARSQSESDSDIMDNSDDKRWVSALNRIKGKLRSRLSDSVVDDLLMISQNGPTPSKVDWFCVLCIWKHMSERGQYTGASVTLCGNLIEFGLLKNCVRSTRRQRDCCS